MRRLFCPPTLLPAALLALVSVVAHPLAAQSDGDRATARALGGDGQQALDSKDYRTAEDRFRRADSLVHAPTLMLGLARALAGEGKYVEAQETYNRMIREGLPPTASEIFKRALAEAKKEIEVVSPKVGGATITVRAAGGVDVPNAKVVLDGAPVNTASLGVHRAIDPGTHVLQVSAEGFKPAEMRFDVAEGGLVDAPVTLEVDPNATQVSGAPGTAPAQLPSIPLGAEQPVTSGRGGVRAVLPWVALGVGVAGLGVGAVTGFIAMGKNSDLANKCGATPCTYHGAQGDIDSYHTVALISTVGFIAGGVGVAAGVVLLVTQPNESGPSALPAQAPRTGFRVVPVIGLGSVGAVGQF